MEVEGHFLRVEALQNSPPPSSFILPPVSLCSWNPDTLPLDGTSPHVLQDGGMSPVLPSVLLWTGQAQGFHGAGAGVLEVLAALLARRQRAGLKTVAHGRHTPLFSECKFEHWCRCWCSALTSALPQYQMALMTL